MIWKRSTTWNRTAMSTEAVEEYLALILTNSPSPNIRDHYEISTVLASDIEEVLRAKLKVSHLSASLFVLRVSSDSFPFLVGSRWVSIREARRQSSCNSCRTDGNFSRWTLAFSTSQHWPHIWTQDQGLRFHPTGFCSAVFERKAENLSLFSVRTFPFAGHTISSVSHLNVCSI